MPGIVLRVKATVDVSINETETKAITYEATKYYLTQSRITHTHFDSLIPLRVIKLD